jgi:hypothetical protein
MKNNAEEISDALDNLDIKSMSFVQLRRLNAALSDAIERIAAASASRSCDDTLGDTVRTAIPSVTKP